MKPLVVISSYPPRPCGIATFVEEQLEFVRKLLKGRQIHIISHTDGEGENVHPIIDLSRFDWYEPVVKLVKELDPYVVHIQHEYGLYRSVSEMGVDERNEGFLRMLDMLQGYPIVVEPHTVHGRLRESEEWFLRQMLSKTTVCILKCAYQKWRLEWQWQGDKDARRLLRRITIVQHGARSDRRWSDEEVEGFKGEIGLPQLRGKHVVGIVGWIQPNKRWELVLETWKDIHAEITYRTGQQWFLLCAGDMRDPDHLSYYRRIVEMIRELEREGIAIYYKFIPRGLIYYKVMAICDFVLLPTVDETQSGTLARIIALNKPFITTAPLEGLTAQAVESEGGLMFTDRRTFVRRVIRLACDESLRRMLGDNLRRYLEEEVSWEVCARKYVDIYETASRAVREGVEVEYPPAL
ncbi:MAG: hypothetical protein RMK18_10115 [Armatimonadota bacterium]|nr:hypothetical protein [Armatimonadota bacterium]MCX7777747.1 hypothetical protein [Armatimonadota bacterium]MDW8026199.1 hypothetical protein [Armatimonadota bacterium]